MKDMGRYFKAPSADDSKQWEKVNILYQAGMYFAGTQRPALGRFPETVREAREFVEKNRAALAEMGRHRDSWRILAIKKLDQKAAKKAELKERRIKNKKEPNKALEPRRLLVTESAFSALRAGTFRAKQPSGSA